MRSDLLTALLLLMPLLGCRVASPSPSNHEEAFSHAAVVIAESPVSRTEPQVELVQYEQAEMLPVPTGSDPGVDGSTLTLADIRAIALENNPTLAKAAARIEVASGRQLQAGLWPNPIAGYHATEMGNNDTAGAQGGFVSQRYVTAGKLRLDRAAAGREADATRFDFQSQELRVLTDVEVRFYEALVAQERVELTQELVAIGERLVEATQTLLTGGQASDNDLLQAEIRAENAHILHDNAQNESDEARRRLVAVVGTPYMPMTTLTGDLDQLPLPFDWELLCNMLNAEHPLINAARMRTERARIELVRARKEPIPNVDLMVSVRHQDGTGDEIANVQAGIPLPIFNRNQGAIRAAEASWMAASQEARRIELMLQDRLAITYRRYTNAFHQADRYRQRIIPKARQSLEIVTSGYDQGQVEYLTVLTAQQTYFEAELSFLNAVRELRVAEATIDGQLLTDSLADR